MFLISVETADQYINRYIDFLNLRSYNILSNYNE